jgi:hypothetical protein
MKSLAVVVTCLCMVLPAFGAPPIIVNAADGIFAAFQNHPLVGLGEWHELAQELDFYAVLVRDPRFAKSVGNIVVETGDAAQQAVVDRYVNGEKVPYTELRKIWFDTVGWFPAVQALGSINFYATVRAVNQGLPPENRIKVWLGDQPSKRGVSVGGEIVELQLPKSKGTKIGYFVVWLNNQSRSQSENANSREGVSGGAASPVRTGLTTRRHKYREK